MIDFRRVQALVLRYTFLYTRSVPRVLEIVFWPVMDLLVWGFLTKYLMESGNEVSRPVTWLLGAMIFWDILYRSQQSITISFLEDTWSRNLLNIFCAPVRITEFIAATYCVGFIKILITVAFLVGLGQWLFPPFRFFDIGWALLPFFANLLVMGWAVGLVTTALIIRWGQAAEALAWGIPFLIQPFSATFYPVHVLPAVLQPVAHAIPATHVFEGMRQVMAGQPVSLHLLVAAVALNLVYLVAAGWFFHFMYNRARARGLLAKLGTQ